MKVHNTGQIKMPRGRRRGRKSRRNVRSKQKRSMSPSIQHQPELNVPDSMETNLVKSALNCRNEKEVSFPSKCQPLNDPPSAKEVKDTPIDFNDIKIETEPEKAVSRPRKLLDKQSCLDHIRSFKCLAKTSDVEPESITATPIQKSKQNPVPNSKIVSNKTQGQKCSKPVLSAKKAALYSSNNHHPRVTTKATPKTKQSKDSTRKNVSRKILKKEFPKYDVLTKKKTPYGKVKIYSTSKLDGAEEERISREAVKLLRYVKTLKKKGKSGTACETGKNVCIFRMKNFLKI